MKNLYLFLIVSTLFSNQLFCMEKIQDNQKITWHKSTFIPPTQTSKEILVKGQILSRE